MKNKILVVINNFDSGGTEQHLLQVLPLLQRQSQNSIYIYAIGGRGKLASRFEQQNIKVIFPKSGLSIFLLIKTLWEIKPDFIHSFLPQAYLTMVLANVFYQRPLIMSRRSLNDYQKKHPFLARLERFSHRFVTFALGNSQAVVNQLLEEGIPKNKIKLIYNGVDTLSYQKKELGNKIENFTMIMVANLRAYKGHVDLLEALHLISKKLPQDWVLLCAGRDEGILNALKEKAALLNLEKQIVWLGEREDIPHLLMQSDLAIACSHEEGFSNSILEAMAAGLPVIATNVGGNPEAVIDQQTGLIVPKKSPAALANAILTLASNETLRKEMGARGCQRVREYFDLNACVNQYKNFYEEVIQACVV